LNSPLILNFKNYLEISGDKTIELAKAAEKVSNNLEVEIVVAPPQASLWAVTNNIDIPVICQHVDDANPGSTTGFFIPEMAKSYGSVGSLINHSEHRIDMKSIRNLVHMLKKLDLISVVCARTPAEVAEIAKVNPDFVAIEPPELIGSGKAISKEAPEIVSSSVKAVSDNSDSARIICGAGIVDKSDVTKALELGAQGILIASGVIKANSWEEKISELASAFT
jgi:triosephosphate isomerase (TIM)